MAVKLFRPIRDLHSNLETNADGYVFRLHYRGTTFICFVAFVFLQATRFLTNPIYCSTGDKSLNLDMLSYKCYTSPTYPIKKPREENTDEPFPGDWRDPEEEQIWYTNYYISIPLFLAISGFLFYLPHAIWQAFEGKNLERLLRGPNSLSLGEDTTRKNNIIRYMKHARGGNFIYSFPYLFCEILNLVNVVVQLVLMDFIAGGTFSKQGSQALSLLVDGDSRTDELLKSFPRMIKCIVHSFGGSGQIRTTDALCVLPQNSLSEKVFILIWVWFVAVATITAAQVVLKMLMYLSFPVRLGMLEFYGRLTVSGDVKKSVRSMSFGDFFLLELLARNLDTVTFRDVLMQMFNSEGEHSEPLYPSVPMSADTLM